MNFVIERDVLQDGVAVVNSAISSKVAKPILSHILIEANGSNVKLSGTDLKIGLECVLKAKVVSPGKACVPARTLVDTVRELPSGSLSMELADNDLVRIDCRNISLKLRGMTPDEFPPLPEFEKKREMVLKQSVLKQLARKTAFSISVDDTRQALTGLYFELRDSVLRVVSTDGRRLSLAKQALDVPGLEDWSESLIVPGKAVSELLHLMKGDGDVTVSIAENHVGFKFDNVVMVVRLIEGSFPNFESVIPKEHTKELIVGTAEICAAIKRAIVMTGEQHAACLFYMKQDGSLTIKVSSLDRGDSVEEVPAQFKGGELAIRFNPKYLLDAVLNVETEETLIEFNGEKQAGVVKARQGDDYLFVVMPVRPPDEE